MQAMPDTPDPLPASQLPRALWDAGVRPAGVQYDPENITEPYVLVRDERDLDMWYPHKRSDHAWMVLAWARAQGWFTSVAWDPISEVGAVRLDHMSGTSPVSEHDWQEPTEAAECEAICRAVLRAVQGG